MQVMTLVHAALTGTNGFYENGALEPYVATLNR